MAPLRILVATDLHLGHHEDDPITGDDSFIAFEEVLERSRGEDVDLLLLGGDIFDTNRPSQNTLTKTIALLTAYCMGDKMIPFQVVSDQKLNFPSKGCVNFEDPNYNIALPVFSIHGNHDDPTGMASIAPIDILSQSNLVNYFGKSSVVDKVEVSPVLIQKGETKLALFGMGHIRDERLGRIFLNGDVSWVRPAEDQGEWFNLFVLHQNREQRGRSTKNYIPTSLLPGFLDLIIWGHEHECRIHPEYDNVKDFYICQPGSTVRTSCCLAEHGTKNVAMLTIQRREFELQPLPLKRQRPFVMQDIEVQDESNAEVEIESHVERLISLSQEGLELPADSPLRIPLVRVRIVSSSDLTINVQQFGQQFVGRVANPESLLILKRKRHTQRHVGEEGVSMHIEEPESNIQISSIVKEVLVEGTIPQIHFENDVLNMIDTYVNQDETQAFVEAYVSP